jgi:VacB/RNase II family 3'-5' exoribonuclease
MKNNDGQHRTILKRIAHQAMIQRGLLPDFSPQVIAELSKIEGPATKRQDPTLDLRHLLWCSIDNDDSLDLDQLTVSEAMPDNAVKILVAIADVDALVKKDSAIDDHARQNTTSVYTPAKIFPMLPEKLSTDMTSLKFASERCALVVEMVITENGSLQTSNVYFAMVCNQSKLAYNRVSAWLENNGQIPREISQVPGLAENLLLQDQVSQQMKRFRHEHGALTLETIEARLIFDEDKLTDLETEKKTRAKDIIEDFMVAANGVTARFLASKDMPSFRRVVRTPKRWTRIVEISLEHRFKLPAEPDSKALELFLTQAKASNPISFPDLSLSIIKLLGPGEYIVEHLGEKATGHFGLAVKAYTHSTAPNRRYPDIITQRLLKGALEGLPLPYRVEELEELAKHCTEKEDAAKKVERQVEKSAAAMLLENRIGEQFDAIVTGATDIGTWVRLLHPPVEGKLTSGFEKMDVGQRLRVRLISTNVERGFIDFGRVG